MYGNIEWTQDYQETEWKSIRSLVETSDGGYVISGFSGRYFIEGLFFSDFWLAKTDSSGNIEWNQTYGRIKEIDYSSSLVVTSDGGYVLAGNNQLFKTDEFGNLMWNQTYGGINWEIIHSLVNTWDGGFAMAGYKAFGEPLSDLFFVTPRNKDFWLVKTDVNGAMEWEQTYGGRFEDIALSLIVTSDGGYAIAGITDSFGAGRYDLWLVKTDELGNIPEFPSWIILPLFATATLIGILVRKRITRTRTSVS